MATSTGVISNYLENKILNSLLKGVSYTPPTTRYIALYTDSTGAGDGDSGNELTCTNYDREQLPPTFVFTISGSMAINPESIVFNQPCSTMGTMVYGWGYRDAATAGNLLFHGLFDSPESLSYYESLRIPAGNLQLSLYGTSTTNGGWGASSASTIISWLVNGTSLGFIPNGAQVALGRDIVLNSGNNLISWTECTGTGYSRKIVPISNWSTSTNGFSYNTSDIVFLSEITDDTWGTISDIVLYDNDTGNIPIFWGHLSIAVTPLKGDGFKISAGSLLVTLN